ncbi:hypothetical protein IPH25_01590 [bacterium]|nr:MAG: hypothetical protein IPG37_03720 [bacterium]QQR62119.1 MAG: hypothetical protein IPH25_01590 [bacterium]QQR63323.1 MAG: hypothetical protein IPH67_02520 [bacterium]
MKKQSSIILTLLAMICPVSEVFTQTGNGLLKKRIIERRASEKVEKIIQKDSMGHMLDRIEGMNKLFDNLKVSSVQEVLHAVEKMQTNLKTLLGELGAQSIEDAIKEVKQVKSVVTQLSRLQATLK